MRINLKKNLSKKSIYFIQCRFQAYSFLATSLWKKIEPRGTRNKFTKTKDTLCRVGGCAKLVFTNSFSTFLYEQYTYAQPYLQNLPPWTQTLNLLQIFSHLKKKKKNNDINFSIHGINAGKKSNKSWTKVIFRSTFPLFQKQNWNHWNKFKLCSRNNNRCESSRTPFVHNEE